MLHAAPREIGDVQQTVDAAQIHERAVIGDVLDDAFDDRAFLQRLEQLLALFALVGFEHGTARHDHVVALAVELDDLEVHLLVFVRRRVLDRTDVDERAGKEGADAVHHDGEAAFHLAVDRALHDGALLEGLFELVPRRQALRLVAREARLAVAVFERFDGDADEVAGLGFDFAAVVAEFFGRNIAFGLEPGIDHDEVVVDAYHFGGDDLADAHFLAGEAFFEERGEAFVGRRCRGRSFHH